MRQMLIYRKKTRRKKAVLLNDKVLIITEIKKLFSNEWKEAEVLKLSLDEVNAAAHLFGLLWYNKGVTIEEC